MKDVKIYTVHAAMGHIVAFSEEIFRELMVQWSGPICIYGFLLYSGIICIFLLSFFGGTGD
jgi:uncharacterized membrane protein YgdD (TMEM256/DUF423 family)